VIAPAPVHKTFYGATESTVNYSGRALHYFRFLTARARVQHR
jgi:hypothetical protein